MITRRALTCLRTGRLTKPCRSKRNYGRIQRRLSSSTGAPTATPSTPQSPAAALASITGELDKLSPRFDVSADSIEIIRSPSEFYETLKAKIAKAQRRVYLSTLYVGKAEYELVGFLTQLPRLATDHSRSTRFGALSRRGRSSRSLY